MHACAGNRPFELDGRAPLEARVLRAVWAQKGQWHAPEAGAVGRGSAKGAKGEWAEPVEEARVMRDLGRLGDLTDGTPGGGGGVSSATGLVRGGDHAAGAFLLKFSDDVALKKAIGAVSVAHDPDELGAAADALVDAFARPGRFERLARTHVAHACAALTRAAREVAGAVGSVAAQELAELSLKVLGRSGVIELLADDGGQEEEEEQVVAMAVDDEEEEDEEAGLEGGESVGVGWRSARVRAENARALGSLVRALRLWAGAGEGSEAGADAVERTRQLTDAAAAMPALVGADVGGGMCLLELMASPEAHARIAAWGMRGGHCGAPPRAAHGLLRGARVPGRARQPGRAERGGGAAGGPSAAAGPHARLRGGWRRGGGAGGPRARGARAVRAHALAAAPALPSLWRAVGCGVAEAVWAGRAPCRAGHARDRPAGRARRGIWGRGRASSGGAVPPGRGGPGGTAARDGLAAAWRAAPDAQAPLLARRGDGHGRGDGCCCAPAVRAAGLDHAIAVAAAAAGTAAHAHLCRLAHALTRLRSLTATPSHAPMLPRSHALTRLRRSHASPPSPRLTV